MANGISRIAPESARKKVITITGGVTAMFYPDGTFNGQRFNVFQIYNDGTAPLYVGLDSNIGSGGENGIGTVVAGGASVFALVGGADQLYLRSAANGSARVYHYYEENIDSNKLYQNLATVIVNSTTTSSVTLAAPIPAGSNNIGSVNIGTMPSVTGSVSLSASLPAGTNGIGKLTANAGVNIGSVDIASALPAGTNAIGKLAANSGVDIGDVDVTSVTPGTAAANLGKAEDAAHASGDVGIMALAVRQDALSALDSATGDYTPFKVDALGRQYVAVVSAANAGTITTVTTTAANTEYTLTIPSGTRKLEITLRRATNTPGNSGDVVKLAWVTGQVAAGTGTCKTFTGDKEYSLSDHLFTSATTLYVASSVAGGVLEMVTYS